MCAVDDIYQSSLIFKFIGVKRTKKFTYDKVDTSAKTTAKRLKVTKLIDSIILFDTDFFGIDGKSFRAVQSVFGVFGYFLAVVFS